MSKAIANTNPATHNPVVTNKQREPIMDVRNEARLTSRPTEQVLAAIQALDVESVKVRMMDPVRGEGWTREHADAVEMTYKNFLSMLVKHPEDAEEIAMSEDTDEFWHTHILQTRKYAEDCQEMFGTYLHHSPHLEEITPEYEATR